MNKAYIAGPWALTEAAGVTEARALECKSAARDATSGETPALTRAEEISRLCREHNRELIKFLLTRVRNEQEAKDVAQEAYMRLLQLDGPVGVGYLRWYLFKIARNIAADHYRHSRIRARLSELDTAAEVDPSSPTENSAIAADQLAALLSALKDLPESCQKAFLLHRFRGLSTVEVAKCMHITDRMVRNHVRRALLYCRFRCDGLTKTEALRLASS
jgi:RNA polymerase sigma-70 factor (ECF subfamily)